MNSSRRSASVSKRGSNSVLGIDRTRAAEALFCSTVEPSDRAAPAEVVRAVERILARYGSGAVCGQVAQLYGDDPDAASARMRWCLSEVAGLTKPAMQDSGQIRIEDLRASVRPFRPNLGSRHDEHSHGRDRRRPLDLC